MRRLAMPAEPHDRGHWRGVCARDAEPAGLDVAGVGPACGGPRQHPFRHELHNTGRTSPEPAQTLVIEPMACNPGLVPTVLSVLTLQAVDLIECASMFLAASNLIPLVAHRLEPRFSRAAPYLSDMMQVMHSRTARAALFLIQQGKLGVISIPCMLQPLRLTPLHTGRGTTLVGWTTMRCGRSGNGRRWQVRMRLNVGTARRFDGEGERAPEAGGWEGGGGGGEGNCSADPINHCRLGGWQGQHAGGEQLC